MGTRPNTAGPVLVDDDEALLEVPTLSGHTQGGQVGFAGKSAFEPLYPDGYLWGPYERGLSRLYDLGLWGLAGNFRVHVTPTVYPRGVDELLPALDVRLTAGRELAFALRAALSGQVAHLRLESPPLEQTKHALAVHVEGRVSPILLIAEPVGFSSEGRFPLRLSVFDNEQRGVFGPLLTACESLPPAPLDDDPFVGRLLNGKYKIELLLGAGGTGRVYQAIHLGLSRAVAVKVLHPFFASSPEFVARFFREAHTASHLDHVHIARMLDCGQEPDGTLFLVMELLSGVTLQAVLDAGGPLSFQRALNVMVQVCGALGAAHEAGVIHRDIKPDNIMLVEGQGDDGAKLEVAKVCDFGIAQLQGDDRPGPLGQVTGTPEYMSPEQGRGDFLDARSDVYACGIVLFQLLTGQVPFRADDLRVLMLLHAHEPPPRASDLRPELEARVDRVLFKCLAKERDARFQSVRELRPALQSLARPLSEAPPVLQELVLLSDPRSGLARVVESLSATLRQAYKSAPRALVDATETIVASSGDLTLSVGRHEQQAKLFATSGDGESVPLDSLVDESTVGAVVRLQKWFREKRLAALTLKAGLTEEDAAALASTSPTSTGLLAATLPAGAIIGAHRKLPWPVELALSRIAHDLANVWSDASIGPARKRDWRTRILRDALQALAAPELLQLALQNGDLVESVVGPTLEGAFAERAVGALPWRRCVALADLLLDGGGKVTLAWPTLVALGRRLAEARTQETETLLRSLEKRGMVARSDLPIDAQDWLRGPEAAQLVCENPRAALRALERASDDRTYARELAWLRHALPLVVRRGDAVATRAVVAMLQEHRRHASTERRAAIAATLAVLSEVDTLRALADLLLHGAQTQWEAARALLAGMADAAEVLVAASTRPV